MGRRCQIFYCDQMRERLCCADCSVQCANRCLNDPSRCNLVDAIRRVRVQAPPKKRTRPPCKHLTQAEKDELFRLLDAGELTQVEIAHKLGCSPSTVCVYAHRWRKEGPGHG